MSTYSRGGFQSRYRCPACDQVVEPTHARRVMGPFRVHARCVLNCSICGEVIETPPIGRGHQSVAVYLGEPVHTACKEKP